MLTVTNKVVLVDVPEGAEDFAILTGRIVPVLAFSVPHEHSSTGMVDEFVNLPSTHTYSWAKMATEVSEQEAAELVDRVGQHFKDYSALDDPKAQWWVRNPLHSLHYLMVSHYHDPNKTIVVKIKAATA